MKKSFEVFFYNVAISVPDAQSPKEAYDRLCQVLGDAGFEWTTDYYTLADNIMHPTSELFPESRDE